MELIKALPEIFEDFAEQRKNSFLTMKELKDKNIPVIGAYCTYFPQEIAMAMGAVTVGLCSTSDETIPVAERDLPRNLCPMVKASYGFAVSDKCPFFYFSDVVVGETTCDGKKKMYELMSEFKNVYVMELPNSQSETALKLLEACRDIIEDDDIAIEDDFYSMGGDSIAAMKISAWVRQHYSVELTVVDVLNNPTIKDWAAVIDRKVSAGRTSEENV